MMIMLNNFLRVPAVGIALDMELELEADMAPDMELEL